MAPLGRCCRADCHPLSPFDAGTTHSSYITSLFQHLLLFNLLTLPSAWSFLSRQWPSLAAPWKHELLKNRRLVSVRILKVTRPIFYNYCLSSKVCRGRLKCFLSLLVQISTSLQDIFILFKWLGVMTPNFIKKLYSFYFLSCFCWFQRKKMRGKNIGLTILMKISYFLIYWL